MRSIRLSILSALLLALATAGTALGWVAPQLAAECAEDENHYSWTINLHAESNQNIQLSWVSDFSVVFDTLDFGTSGPHSFETVRGGATLYVRYASDHNAKASAAANAELCEPPVVVSAQLVTCEGSEDTPRIRVQATILLTLLHLFLDGAPVEFDTNTGDAFVEPGTYAWSIEDLDGRVLGSGSLTVEPCATEASEPEGSQAGATGTPAGSIPDTAASVVGFSGPLTTVGFGLILLGSLGALAYANMRGARERS